MLTKTFTQDLEYLRKKFQAPVFEKGSGLDYETLKKRVLDSISDMEGLPHPVIKAKAFELIARNVQIEVSSHDWFPSFGCWNRKDRPMAGLLRKFSEKTAALLTKNGLWENLNTSGSSAIWVDFDHSVPDWDLILKFGFPGLRENARSWRCRHEAGGAMTPEQAAYFDGIDITYAAILELLDRFHAYALQHSAGKPRLIAVAAALKALHDGPPQTFYQVLLTIYLFFMFSEHIDYLQVRSLGNLDNLLLPWFEQELEKQSASEAEMRERLDYFLMQWGAIDNYWGHPFYLGGTDEQGCSRINRLSFIILEEFEKLQITSPKIQLKIARNTPDEFLDAALKMIRRSNSSLVFVGEESIARAMTSLGMTEADARTCDIRGCYEFAARGRHNENDTGCAYLNMLKPLELVFNNGIDPKTKLHIGPKTGLPEELQSFDDFYRAYILQLSHIIEADISVCNEFECFLNQLNPANVFSAAVQNSLLTAKDAFHDGCFYNNTTLLNAGFASTVDALCAVREMVYLKKEVTLAGFKEILDANWSNHEKFRLKILKDCPHYGNGNPVADHYAGMLGRFLSTKINGRPNSRGGLWKASIHSARQFIELGKKTGATPDGRFAGEEMSKNSSPVMGMDRSGVTALIRSAAVLDAGDFPADLPLDVMLHPTAVEGEEGLTAWRRLIREYLLKGLAIHFNVFTAETLREAQKNPDKYAGLQIRVCGWNVHFVKMAPEEQEMYIRRAENLAP